MGKRCAILGTTGPPHFKVIQGFLLGFTRSFFTEEEARIRNVYLVSDDMERRPPTFQKSTFNDKQNKKFLEYITSHFI